MKKTNNFGFTLIELLIVIAIIGVLVTILVVAINPVYRIRDARDTKRRADLLQIKAGMQLYYNDCKFYPTALPSGNWGNVSGNACDDNSTYMRNVPTDPSGNAYLYAVAPPACGDGACTSYTITANLQNTQNSGDTSSLTTCSTPVPTGEGSNRTRVCND